ncbi:hypothetical protein [Oleiagrimonas soli]|nr:hypothetical protein [Oleiagrimonas soli]MBB6184808.1 hypothetical protein [Oleiagrimonas soli]
MHIQPSEATRDALPSPAARPWWRKLLVPVALAVLALVVLSPEFAFLGVFLDAAVVDVLMMMLGMQLLLFRDQWLALARNAWTATARRWRSLRRR